MTRKRYKPSKPRNPLHAHPLLRKSAVHEKSTKAKRQQARVKLRKEWQVVCA